MLRTYERKALIAYSAVITTLLAFATMSGCVSRARQMDEITVHRINIVETDGTLRMVISNHARLPGIIVKGKEQAFDRPQAGMIFYNDEGSENGGLIFGGRRYAKGEIKDSGGSLSFDKYGANQIVQLAGVSDNTDRFAGLRVWDSSLGGEGNSRVWLGHTDDGSATLALMDARGRKRIVLEVKADGTSSLVFLDAEGKPVNRLLPSPPSR